MIKLTHYYDAGHGWIPVKRDFLKRLGVHHRVSSYSYQKGATVYLEEDCDASLLIAELNKLGVKFQINHICHGDRSQIRSYDCYSPHYTEKYCELLLRIGSCLDKHKEFSYRETLIKLREIFRYESRYSSKPDTATLKKYVKYANKALTQLNC